MADGDETRTWAVRITTIAAILVAYLTINFIYNVYFHPLAKIPGPVTWSGSRIPFVQALLRGTIVHDFQDLHRQYGPILRIAPDEVTFSTPDAWPDIFQPRSSPGSTHQQQFLKDPTWWARQPGKPDSLLSAINPEPHARIRKTLAPAFTPRALRSQEPILHQYVTLLVDRLHGMVIEADQGSGKVVDMTPWFHFTTFDIFGDLGFGESFDCLQNSRYHPWISLLFGSVKAASYVAAARFYPVIEAILLKCIPASLKKTADNHFQQIADKVNRRFNWELERPDIMSHVIKEKNDDEEGKVMPLTKGMTTEEIYCTFMILTTAGSETTATALTGTLNYLVSCPDKLALIVREIRDTFNSRDEMTLDALRDLPYLNAVINEGLRLCPPIPWMLPRLVPPGGETVSGVRLPGGTRVSIQAYTMNRDPKYWHQSTTFLPERWLPEASTNEKSPFFTDRRHALQTFSMGPRSCLGQHLAMAEMRLILSHLLWNFDFEAAPIPSQRLRWEDLRTFLLVEKKPVNVTIKLRKGTV